MLRRFAVTVDEARRRDTVPMMQPTVIYVFSANPATASDSAIEKMRRRLNLEPGKRTKAVRLIAIEVREAP